jgi:hypothetical protein
MWDVRAACGSSAEGHVAGQFSTVSLTDRIRHVADVLNRVKRYT